MSTSKTDQLTKIRTLLLVGEKLTVLGVFRITRTYELRHYLSILRKEGMKIADEWVKNQSTQKRYKVFWLSRE